MGVHQPDPRRRARARAELLTVPRTRSSWTSPTAAASPASARSGRRHHGPVQLRAEPGASTFVDLIAARRPRGRRSTARALDTAAYDAGERAGAARAWPPTTSCVVDADCALHQHRRGAAPVRRPGRRRGLPLLAVRDRRRASGCTPASTSPTSRRTFALTVTAPARLGGRLQRPRGASRRGDRRRAGGRASRPPRRSRPYVTALVAGPYHERDRHATTASTSGVYCRASLAEHLDADEIFEVTKQGFDWFHRAFDYRYPFDKYDQLFVPGVQRRRDGERRPA